MRRIRRPAESLQSLSSVGHSLSGLDAALCELLADPTLTEFQKFAIAFKFEVIKMVAENSYWFEDVKSVNDVRCRSPRSTPLVKELSLEE